MSPAQTADEPRSDGQTYYPCPSSARRRCLTWQLRRIILDPPPLSWRRRRRRRTRRSSLRIHRSGNGSNADC